MQTFLEETLSLLQSKHDDLASLTIILPSKRAGGFLKYYLRKQATKTTFAPRIISIEEFIEEISDLKIIDTTELIFKSYDAYLKTKSIPEKEDFETFASWSSTLLNDFNEIDRYLVDPDRFFTYLASIKTMERWGVVNETTELIKNYLTFWEALPEFYKNIQQQLLIDGIAYQGLVYRKASEKIEHYIKAKPGQKHVFIGFNALNNAEQHIIQELLETGYTEVYWDSDAYFYEDTEHSASIFLRKYLKHWKYYQVNTVPKLPKNFEAEKQIQFVEVQKNIGQAKYVGQLLANLSEEELNKTAIVLADENLLLPILHSLPANVSSVNITMGIPLKNFPITVFFELLLKVYTTETEQLYFKDVFSILNHPVAIALLENPKKIISHIQQNNITHCNHRVLIDLADEKDKAIVAIMFKDCKNKSQFALDACIAILLKLKATSQEQPVARAAIHKLYSVFKEIEALNTKFKHIKTVKTIQSLFTEFISGTTLDFEGDAYNGLQIMGILETRVLDFERVIITSVNEGTLPSGKSNASFITYDLKQEFKLPNYFEKDAIYTYHFYHLLHRAKSITLLYNNYSEGINTGEKSRFLLQLEIEQLPAHTIENIVLSPPIKIETPELKTITKSEAVLERLKSIAQKGFSPSALTSYVRNPLDFYFQRILKVSELDEVEETVAANTLGTIVHDSLESLYKPLIGQSLNSENLNALKDLISQEVKLQFTKTFKGGTIEIGKNLIIFEVAKRYVYNLIQLDLKEIKAGNTLKILQVEERLSVPIHIPELNFPVNISGIVDRVDAYNGQIRIIDYKTGLVQQGDLTISDWSLITKDYKYSKAFQILAYAYMLLNNGAIENVQAGIISFKNLNNGFLNFTDKTNTSNNNNVSEETLQNFLSEAKKLILEICDPTIPFTEKEIDK